MPLASSMRDVMWGLDGLAEVLEGDLPSKADLRQLVAQDSALGQVGGGTPSWCCRLGGCTLLQVGAHVHAACLAGA